MLNKWYFDLFIKRGHGIIYHVCEKNRMRIIDSEHIVKLSMACT